MAPAKAKRHAVRFTALTPPSTATRPRPTVRTVPIACGHVSDSALIALPSWNWQMNTPVMMLRTPAAVGLHVLMPSCSTIRKPLSSFPGIECASSQRTTEVTPDRAGCAGRQERVDFSWHAIGSAGSLIRRQGRGEVLLDRMSAALSPLKSSARRVSGRRSSPCQVRGMLKNVAQQRQTTTNVSAGQSGYRGCDQGLRGRRNRPYKSEVAGSTPSAPTNESTRVTSAMIVRRVDAAPAASWTARSVVPASASLSLVHTHW